MIFYSEGLPRFATFYRVVPSVLLCYFVPSLLSTFNIIDVSHSQIYYFASRYLLPSALFLLLINIDFKGLRALGAKSLLMFLAATVGVMLGAPLTLLIIKAIFPSLLSPDLWRGFTTIAGSWIGGAANQMSMKEIFSVGDDLFSAMITVDVIVANLWLAFLLFLVARWIRAPLFMASVGSIANIGGTASSPIMASAFHTSLIPVAIALAILGYAIGTICAYLTGLMMMGI